MCVCVCVYQLNNRQLSRSDNDAMIDTFVILYTEFVHKRPESNFGSGPTALETL